MLASAGAIAESSQRVSCGELRPTIGSFRKRIEGSEGLKRVRDLASGHFGSKMDIRFVDDTSVKVPADSGDGTEAAARDESISVRKLEDGRRAKLEQSAVEDPSVKAALQVLGGRIERISQVDD
jgi:hypothetical protein